MEEGVRDELRISHEQPLGLGCTQEWGIWAYMEQVSCPWTSKQIVNGNDLVACKYPIPYVEVMEV